MVGNIETKFRNPFKKFTKKINKVLQGRIHDEIKKVSENPKIGVKKDGDLGEFFVHKFKISGQEYLIAYKIQESDGVDSSQPKICESVEFYLVGPHENFYRDLRKYVQS